MKNIVIKISDSDTLKELNSVGFDKLYIDKAKDKYLGCGYKIFNLKSYEANILKQLSLSLGFDCAVNRGTIKCECEYTDAIIFASFYQYKNLCEKLKNQPFRLKELAKQLEAVINGKLIPLKLRNYVFDWSRPYIAGILNVTPDSFSDGGKYNNLESAIEHVKKMISEGADIIDIGGESTRPGADRVPVEEEINRIIPVIKRIRDNGINIPLSVDTRNYDTAKLAFESGCDLLNDVSFFNDKKLFDYAVSKSIPVVCMHSDNVPAYGSMQERSLSKEPNQNIIDNIYIELKQKIQEFSDAGFDISKIIIDPGIGFGKNMEANFNILKRIDEFKSLNQPVLLGISRKSFIRNQFNTDINEADKVSALYSCMLKSVNIHRVHNVGLVKRYLKYSSKIL